ncbi:MAG: type IV toxin-antitoxin system AbiEi family antitoxin domain-containing protein [Caldisericaceae bacterium]
MDDKYRKIVEIFKEHNGYARSKDILANGIHSRNIKNALEEGLITKVKNGIYRLSDTPVISSQSLVDISYAIPEGIICMLSALSYYELTTFNPSVISVAIHRKSWKPKIEYPPVEIYYFSTKQFEAGIETITVAGHKVRIYSPEKTICDCIRYRSKLGLDIAKEGLKEYLKRKNRNLEKLLDYAEICRVKPLLQEWLNVLV